MPFWLSWTRIHQSKLVCESVRIWILNTYHRLPDNSNAWDFWLFSPWKAVFLFVIGVGKFPYLCTQNAAERFLSLCGRVASGWWRTGSGSCRCGAWCWSRRSTSAPGSSTPRSAASPTGSSSPTRRSSPSWGWIHPPTWTCLCPLTYLRFYLVPTKLSSRHLLLLWKDCFGLGSAWIGIDFAFLAPDSGSSNNEQRTWSPTFNKWSGTLFHLELRCKAKMCKFKWCVTANPGLVRIQIRMDPLWFGFLDP